MPANILEIADDLITVRVSGVLTYLELVENQKQAVNLMQHVGMIRFLVIAEDFEGWAKDGDWGDVSFQAENDARIEKIAIVGEKKWEELVTIFMGQGVRRFPIQYFLPEDIEKARQWIAEPA